MRDETGTGRNSTNNCIASGAKQLILNPELPRRKKVVYIERIKASIRNRTPGPVDGHDQPSSFHPWIEVAPRRKFSPSPLRASSVSPQEAARGRGRGRGNTNLAGREEDTSSDGRRQILFPAQPPKVPQPVRVHEKAVVINETTNPSLNEPQDNWYVSDEAINSVLQNLYIKGKAVDEKEDLVHLLKKATKEVLLRSKYGPPDGPGETWGQKLNPTPPEAG